MNNNYILIHRNGSSQVEFHLPDDCYLIQDEQGNVQIVFRALDDYLKGIDKSNVPSVLETLIGQYTTYANIHVDWIEIY